MEERQTVDYHLQQALIHLDEAVNQSIEVVIHQHISQKEIGQKWEYFLAHFYQTIREKGRQNKVNLLHWITFPRLRH
ncbi:hypothetical protein [Desulfitobacterium sp. AusDCA]|uniref:hypothetical protein n=1 Tax=Desulfitobacterium sp. AusDCA TaxID=3240383 RepID=UPI003DA7744B